MGPTANQTALLIREMGQLDLQRALARSCALSKNLENEAGSIEDLRLPGLLQIALLHRRHGMVDDDQFRLCLSNQRFDLVDLAGTEEGAGLRRSQRHQEGLANIEVDGFGQTPGFREPVLRTVGGGFPRIARVGSRAPRLSLEDGNKDNRLGRLTPPVDGASAAFAVLFQRFNVVFDGAYPCAVSAGSLSMRCTGAPGMIVEMACL